MQRYEMVSENPYKWRRKVLVVLGILLLLFWSTNLQAFAETEAGPFTQGYFKYYATMNDDGDFTGIRIVEYYGNEMEVTVPTAIAGVAVDNVETDAFAGTAVTTVHMAAQIGFDAPDELTVVRDDPAKATASTATETPEPTIIDPAAANRNDELINTAKEVESVVSNETSQSRTVTYTDGSVEVIYANGTIMTGDGQLIRKGNRNDAVTMTEANEKQARLQAEAEGKNRWTIIAGIIAGVIIIAGIAVFIIIKKAKHKV